MNKKPRPRRACSWPIITKIADINEGHGWVMVSPFDDDEIQLVLPRKAGDQTGVPIYMTRSRARLVAKRINECLDGTQR